MAQTTKYHAIGVGNLRARFGRNIRRGRVLAPVIQISSPRSRRMRPPRRLSQAEFELARQRIEPLVQAAQSSLDRLYLAVGGVGCCVLLADRDGVPVERRGARATTRRSRLGLVDRLGLERGERGHQRHRHLPGRAARADHPSRPAFPRAQHAAELHHRADLRSRGQTWPRRSTCPPAAPI